MTEHVMNLNPLPFLMIKNGTKTIELRLYDEKRKKISVGDTAVFINAADPGEKLYTMVDAIYLYSSFKDLYRELPLLECGYTESDIQKASPSDMEKYYSTEKQEKYGVVGIRIHVI